MVSVIIKLIHFYFFQSVWMNVSYMLYGLHDNYWISYYTHTQSPNHDDDDDHHHHYNQQPEWYKLLFSSIGNQIVHSSLDSSSFFSIYETYANKLNNDNNNGKKCQPPTRKKNIKLISFKSVKSDVISCVCARDIFRLTKNNK